MKEPRRYTAEEWLQRHRYSTAANIVYLEDLAEAEAQRADWYMFRNEELRQEIEWLRRERAIRFAA